MLRECRVCTMGATVLPPAAQHKSPIDLTPLPQFHFQEVLKKPQFSIQNTANQKTAVCITPLNARVAMGQDTKTNGR